jgi:hypothetical protein
VIGRNEPRRSGASPIAIAVEVVRMVASLLLMGSLSSLPSTWSDGRVPEGDNAYTVARGEVRIAAFGRSVLGLTDRLEASTDLLFPTPEIPFPNLHLKWRFFENDVAALALDGGGGFGLLPFAGGGALPGPGFIIGVVGVGAALGSFQPALFTEAGTGSRLC